MTTIEYPRELNRAPVAKPAPRTLTRAAWRRRRRARPMPASIARAIRGRNTIAIRRGNAGDEEALTRLAELSERPQPTWPLLVAEVDGEIVAAISVDCEAEMRSPFQVTADVVALLRLRAEQLRETGPR